MTIDSGTRLTALFGDPIAHSVSPAMHNAAFRHSGLNFTYLAFRVTESGLEAALEAVRALNIRGINLTIPHKTAALPLLDEVTESARRVGAVNTIVNDNGRLKGHNTDVSGFLTALRGHGFNSAGRKAVVLGAGGAARAVVFALRDAGAAVTVLNRTPAKAAELAAATGAIAGDLGESSVNTALDGAELLINATSVGLYPESEVSPLADYRLKPGLTVMDTIYRPRRTRLLADAQAAGCRVIDGLDMLVAQGAESFELWTGRSPDRTIMLRAAEEALR